MSAHPLRRHAVLAVWVTDLGLLGFALTSAALGRLLGFPALGAIAAVATLPLAVLIFDILPQRGAIVGGLVIVLGSLMIPAEAGPLPLLAWSLLALAGVTAVIGPAMTLPPENEVAMISPPHGRILKIIVRCQGPSERGGIAVRPKASPRFDPERRSLTRRRGARQPGQVARSLGKKLPGGLISVATSTILRPYCGRAATWPSPTKTTGGRESLWSFHPHTYDPLRHTQPVPG